MPRGQCTISGAAMPPSCVKCLNRRKGVLLSVAQFIPRYRFEFGPPGRIAVEAPVRTGLGVRAIVRQEQDHRVVEGIARFEPLDQVPMLMSSASIIAA